MQLIYSFTVALFLTIALIPLLIRYSGKLQLLDSPEDDRKIHTEVIPRSGGLAIVMGVMLPLLFLLPIENEFKGLLWGAAVIVVFGYFDDRYELDYKWKFFGQILAVIAVMLGGVSIARVPMLGLDPAALWISLPLTFFFLLGATNAVNLSDGLDGLAGGTSLLGLGLVAIFALLQDNHSVALVALTVIGGLMGFLRYNTFPAKIFMGDTGSQFLGYMVACLAILASQGESCTVSPVLPLLILGLPILDTMTVMVIRLKEKRSPFSPDKNHIHHQLMALGLRHVQAVGIIYVIQVGLMISAYFLRYENDFLILFFYFSFSAVFIGILSMGHRKVSSNMDFAPVEGKNKRNYFLRKLDWFYYNSTHIVQSIISVLMIAMTIAVITGSEVRNDFALMALALAICLGAFSVLLSKRRTSLVARFSAYTASVFAVYLFSSSGIDGDIMMAVNGLFTLLVLVLVLAIRMTRKEDFRLDTQDLLVLVLVVIVPQLPFDGLDNHTISLIALKLAALMYGCEYVLGKARTNYRILTMASLTSLVLFGLSAFI